MLFNRKPKSVAKITSALTKMTSALDKAAEAHRAHHARHQDASLAHAMTANSHYTEALKAETAAKRIGELLG